MKLSEPNNFKEFGSGKDSRKIKKKHTCYAYSWTYKYMYTVYMLYILTCKVLIALLMRMNRSVSLLLTFDGQTSGQNESWRILRQDLHVECISILYKTSIKWFSSGTLLYFSSALKQYMVTVQGEINNYIQKALK